jgi:hypothetical protein
MKKYNKLFIALVLAVLVTSGCRKYLDINGDPASPQNPNLPSILPPVTAVMSRSMVFDGRFVGQYIHNWSHTTGSENYDIHGGNVGGSGANQLWRDFYTVQGTAINLIIKKGILEEQWDYVGVALALRAWGLQTTTDYFGEMPFRQAWEENRVYFEYDKQDYLYKAVDSLCRKSLEYLVRTDGKVSQSVLARGDQVYRGDRQKWIKFVYGLMARNWHRLTNKPDYNPDSVIAFVNNSFTSNADNFMVIHTASRNDDSNPLGPARDNFSVRRQSRFIVQLLDGTTLIGNSAKPNRDPRLARMLSASPDTTTTNATMPALNGGYRFLTPAAGFTIGTLPGTTAFRQSPSTLWGDSAIVNPGINNFTARTGKYLFQNQVGFPIMTYFELQFLKAEAEFRKAANSAAAYTAYRNGIDAHMSFVNSMNTSATGVTQISSTERNDYLNGAAVKQNAAALTLTDIMLQKYIGDFGWNFVECWADIRRYHYYDLDPATGLPVYKNYNVTVFSSNNLGPKLAFRFRPTNFSEFDWNLDELRKIGATNQDYHTYEMWFSKP